MNLKNTLSVLSLLVLCILFLPKPTQAQTVNLFNGEDLSGWHMDVPEFDKDANARKPFIVRDGMLVSLGTPGGHLITNKEYANYRLDIEYRFAAEPGNCGALVHASTPRALYDMFPKSLEVQMQHGHAGDFWCIVEDIVVPNMVKRRGPENKWGIVEGKNRRVENLTDDSEKPLGEWNHMRIDCNHDTIQVWLNDDLVNFGYNCTASSGQIAIQAEGSEVEFRKISLTPLGHSYLEHPAHLETPSGALEGTLLQPEKLDRYPVALIIAGSGPTDRDGNNVYMKNNSLKFLAEGLARNGIASLRYDKRGVGASASAAKQEIDLRFGDYIADAKLWIQHLQADKRFSAIYVLGHSEGSLIGMVASQDLSVDKYVSLAGAGNPIDLVIRKQLSTQSEVLAEQSGVIMDSLLAGHSVNTIPPALFSLFRPSVQPYLRSWFQFNPQVELQKLTVPVLIVNGTTDIQVDIEEAQLLNAAVPTSEIQLIEGMNHIFKLAPADRQLNLMTYSKPDLALHPDFLEKLINFLHQE